MLQAEMSSFAIKLADRRLFEWSSSVRGGNRIDIGYKISSAYGTKVPGIEHDNDIYDVIDHIVGRLQDPFKRIITRHYLDPVPNKKHLYFSRTRTITNKAKTEKLAVSTYKDYLNIGRTMVYNEIEKLTSIA